MKKTLAIILSAIMILSCIPACIFAEAWDGSTTADFSGTGTAEDPYVIDSAEKLAKLAVLVNAGEPYAGKYFTQTADIDLGNKEWNTIGRFSSNAFSGVYNGLGHSITNLYISAENSNVGLFGYLASTTSVSAGVANLIVKGTIVRSGDTKDANIGGLVGFVNTNASKTAKLKDAYFINVICDVDITDTSSARQPRIGGLFGQIFCAVVENCVNNGTLKSVNATAAQRLGGFCGQCNRTSFKNCVNNGDVSGNSTNNSGVQAGGFTSYVTVADSDDTYTVFTNCVNNGNISATTGGASASFAAGIDANVYATSGKPIRAKFEYCVNNGTIRSVDGGATGYPYAGGIAGIGAAYPNFNIDHCVNTVPASGFTSTGGAGARAGGIIGACWQASVTDVWVRNTVSASNTCPAYQTPTGANDKSSFVENNAKSAETAAQNVIDSFTPSTVKINGFPTDVVCTAAGAIELINVIGTVALNSNSKSRISLARACYDALTSGEKALVSANQLKVLTDAEAAYKSLADAAAAAATVALINAIGEVEYTSASKTKIETARASYGALSADQKALVTADQLKVLTDAEAAYRDLAFETAISLIAAIGTPDFCDEDCESQKRLNAARDAYDALTAEQKAVFPSDTLKVLTDAEFYFYFDGIESTVNEFSNFWISADQNVSQADWEHICSARDLFFRLSDEQRLLFGTALKKFQADSEQNYARITGEQPENSAEDRAAASSAIAAINAIGTVAYTEESKAKLISAINAYFNLTCGQKLLVSSTTFWTLINANNSFITYQEEADNIAAEPTIRLINDIVVVALNDTCKGRIDAARASFEALSILQKAVVIDTSWYKKLTDAEGEYAKLKANKEAADATLGLIDAIGEVAYTDASKAKIDEARAAYNALTADQKAYVADAKLRVLNSAESEYAALKKAADDKAAADAAVEVIENIGDVENTSACLTRILRAREAYDALTADQKALVPAEELKKLTDAEDARVVPEPSYELRVVGKYDGKPVAYRSDVSFEAVTQYATDIEWFVTGADYTLNADGTITVTSPKNDFSVSFSGKGLDGSFFESETMNIKVKTSFLDKLLAFFQYILNLILSMIRF